MKNTIKCPHCGKEIEIDKVVKHEITEQARAEIEITLREKIENEKGIELQTMQTALKEKEEKISEFREMELELRDKARKLEDKEKDLELETQRRLDEEKRKVEEATIKRLVEEHNRTDSEKDKRMSDMRKQIEDLKRVSQQGSMQTQGEVGELELEETLRQLFPTDEVTEVKKGELGGDVKQMVKTQRGTSCGMIIWERKRTKSWDEKWISKLKEDLQRDKAHLGVIITEVLPKDFKSEIGERSGIWITTKSFVEPLAMLLRKILYDVAKEKSRELNKQSTAEEIYDYVTSNEFIQQVDRISRTYREMNEQISKERAVSERQWKMREMQIARLITGVSGIYGSMQGIAGSALPQVKSLELQESVE